MKDKILTTIDEVQKYLSVQRYSNKDNPVKLCLQVDLGVMTKEHSGL